MNIPGLDDLLSKLAAMPDKLQRAAKSSLKKTADRAADDVRRLIPVDSGTLAASVAATETKRGASVAMGATKDGFDYAIAVEFGTSTMAVTPVMRPAFNSAKANAIADVAREARGAAE